MQGESKVIYRVVAEYPGPLSEETDKKIISIMGTAAAGSGFCFCCKMRDISATFLRKKSAEKCEVRLIKSNVAGLKVRVQELPKE